MAAIQMRASPNRTYDLRTAVVGLGPIPDFSHSRRRKVMGHVYDTCRRPLLQPSTRHGEARPRSHRSGSQRLFARLLTFGAEAAKDRLARRAPRRTRPASTELAPSTGPKCPIKRELKQFGDGIGTTPQRLKGAKASKRRRKTPEWPGPSARESLSWPASALSPGSDPYGGPLVSRRVEAPRTLHALSTVTSTA
jgi:hypothetical protein